MVAEIKKVKLWKQGNSWVFTVPKDYVTNGLLKLNKHYKVVITEND